MACLAVLLVYSFDCGLYAQIKSVSAVSVDFSNYCTYQFTEWSHDSDLLINDKDKARVIKALQEELKRRGLKPGNQDSACDLTVSFYMVLSEESSIKDYKSHVGEIGFEPKWGWIRGACVTCDHFNEFHYVKGTLVLDVYDSGNNALVWQSVNARLLRELPEKREKSIPKHMSKMLRMFPKTPID